MPIYPESGLQFERRFGASDSNLIQPHSLREWRFSAVSDTLSSHGFDEMFLRLCAPGLFSAKETRDVLCSAMNVDPGTAAPLDIRMGSFCLHGHSRTIGKIDVTLGGGEGARSLTFALKMLRGCERSFSEELAKREVALSKRFAREPLFQKHFAPSYGLIPLDVPEAVKESMVIELGLHPAAIPPRTVFQIDRWVCGTRLQDAVSSLLKGTNGVELPLRRKEDTLVEFGGRVLSRLTQCWDRIKSGSSGLIYDAGPDDVILTAPPGREFSRSSDILSFGEPVFIDGDGDQRSGGVAALRQAHAGLISSIFVAMRAFGVSSGAQAGMDESGERVLSRLSDVSWKIRQGVGAG